MVAIINKEAMYNSYVASCGRNVERKEGLLEIALCRLNKQLEHLLAINKINDKSQCKRCKNVEAFNGEPICTNKFSALTFSYKENDTTMVLKSLNHNNVDGKCSQFKRSK